MRLNLPISVNQQYPIRLIFINRADNLLKNIQYNGKECIISDNIGNLYE